MSFCVFVYSILMLGNLIANLILSIIYLSEMSLGSQLYDYPLKNWRTDVVIDFDARVTCNNNNIFHYTWPGTMNGCQCMSGNLNEGSCCVPTQQQTCSSSGSDCRGSNIDGVPAKNAEIWELNNTSIQICATRLQSYNYYSKTPDGSNRCASNQDQMCGSGVNGFCVPKDSKCPIRDFLFSEESQELNNIYQEQILITGSTYMYLTRNPINVNPVAQFRVGEGNSICLRNSHTTGTPSHQQYILKNQDTDSSCQTDPRFIPQLQIGEKRFFYLNGIDSVINSLPSYTLSDSNIFQNFYNHINYLNPSCKQYLPQIFDNSNLLREIQSISVGLLILCCLSMAHFLFFDMWSSFLSLASHQGDQYGWGNVLCQSKITKLKTSNWESRDLIYQFFILIQYVIIICQLAIVAAINGKINQEVQFMDDLREMNCSDKYFYTICQIVVNSVTNSLGIVILGLTIAIILIDPTLFFAIKFIITRSLCKAFNPEINIQPISDTTGTNNIVSQVAPISGTMGLFNQRDDDELFFQREPHEALGKQQINPQNQSNFTPISYNFPQTQPYPQTIEQPQQILNNNEPQNSHQQQQFPQNPNLFQPEFYMPQQHQLQQIPNPVQQYRIPQIKFQPLANVIFNVPQPTINIINVINQINNINQTNHNPSPDPNKAEKQGEI